MKTLLTQMICSAVLMSFLSTSCTTSSDSLHFSDSSQKNDLTNGLVAYYPFNNNALDESENKNDGTVEGAKLIKDRNGRENSAYAFDGIDDHIYVPDHESLQITDAITLSVWFKTQEAVPFAGILCKSEVTGARSGYLIDIDQNERLRVDLLKDHSQHIFGKVITDKSIDILDNEWHHVVVTYDGQSLRLYLDDQLVDTEDYLERIQKNNEPLLIGWDRNTWLSNRRFKGAIDDIRIYNRALTSRELALLFRE